MLPPVAIATPGKVTCPPVDAPADVAKAAIFIAPPAPDEFEVLIAPVTVLRSMSPV